MGGKISLARLRAAYIKAVGDLFDFIEELNSKCADLDEKVEHLIRKRGNGGNHQSNSAL